jgi:hypothetical protein
LTTTVDVTWHTNFTKIILLHSNRSALFFGNMQSHGQQTTDTQHSQLAATQVHRSTSRARGRRRRRSMQPGRGGSDYCARLNRTPSIDKKGC